ncbi:Uncharacterized protein At1g66480, partial [Linum perenne]
VPVSISPLFKAHQYLSLPIINLFRFIFFFLSEMGNSIGTKYRRRAKVMKIDGETFKIKTPVRAGDVLNNYPGHCLLESESVKHYSSRAKPLEPNQNLLPNRLYFLVDIPHPNIINKASPFVVEKTPRRVWSGPINMTAKDRLESMMLARRSASDISLTVSGSVTVADHTGEEGTMRVKMRLPRSEVERLMRESRDEAEAGARIMDLYAAVGNRPDNSGGRRGDASSSVPLSDVAAVSGHVMKPRQQKRVSFMPINEAEMNIAVASY